MIKIYVSISKSKNANRKLFHRLWNEHGVSLKTKRKCIEILYFGTLLYGAELWCPYNRHIKKLETFHMCCPQNTWHLKWQDKIPNVKIFEKLHLQYHKNAVENSMQMGSTCCSTESWSHSKKCFVWPISRGILM